ncbi:MAG: hypothetical protein MCSN_4480 [Candidatus Microsyncoccus archaeolyticus]|nr:MAG: hypothetical protein MCSN_4480 [Candidatus Parcubacteria bacterium]
MAPWGKFNLDKSIIYIIILEVIKLYVGIAIKKMESSIDSIRPEVTHKASIEDPSLYHYRVLKEILDFVEGKICTQKMPLAWYSQMGQIVNDIHQELSPDGSKKIILDGYFSPQDRERFIMMLINDASKLIKEAETN